MSWRGSPGSRQVAKRCRNSARTRRSPSPPARWGGGCSALTASRCANAWCQNPSKDRASLKKVGIIAVDLAKNVFQSHGAKTGDRRFTFIRLDPAQWKAARTTNAIEPLNEAFRRRIKTRTLWPCAKTTPMLHWARLASGQIRMRQADGGETLLRPIAPKTGEPVA